MRTASTRADRFLALLENLAAPENGAAVIANSAQPALLPSSLAEPTFDTHWQTADGDWPTRRAVVRIDWPEPVTLDYVALLNVAYRGVKPEALRWAVEVSPNGGPFEGAVEQPLVVRSPWGLHKWGEPGLWSGGPTRREAAMLSADLQLNAGIQLSAPVRAKAIRLTFPTPQDIEPGAYLRISEVWPALAWQPEHANIAWGAGYGIEDLSSTAPTPDGFDFGEPGVALRSFTSSFPIVGDRELHYRWLAWRRRGSGRAFVVPHPYKSDIWHQTAMVAKARDVSGSVEGFWDDTTDKNSLSITWQEYRG